jgi:hypothetical protein
LKPKEVVKKKEIKKEIKKKPVVVIGDVDHEHQKWLRSVFKRKKEREKRVC